MKVPITIETGRRLPGDTGPKSKTFLAWAELDGQPITGVLAQHTNRDMAEVAAAGELSRRLRHILDHTWREPKNGKGDATKGDATKDGAKADPGKNGDAKDAAKDGSGS